MTDDRPVSTEVADRVATVMLDRPGRRNALSGAMLRELGEAMADLDARPDVDVVILTGADPAFCAGLDLELVGAADSELLERTKQRRPFPAMRKPVLGAINGPATTGGLELALACTFRIASEHAAFADTHARVGIHPGWGLTVRLREAIGADRAAWMSATGSFIDARTAEAWGLVTQVVPHADLLPTARSVAAEIVANDQGAVRQVLDTYARIGSLGEDAALDYEYTTSRTWRGDEGLDTGEVERRRDDIIRRGRRSHAHSQKGH